MTTTIRFTDNNTLRLLLPLLILAVGALLRFQAIQDTKVIAAFGVDAGQYAAYAVNVLEHNTYSKDLPDADASPTPDSVRVPVYPMLIAAVTAASPRAPLVLMQYLQAALSTVTILLALLLFRRFLPWSWSNGAALLVAISPHLVMANVYILTESLFTFGLLATLLVCVYAYERGGKATALIAGMALGLLTLTRTAVQYFILVAAALFRFKGQPARFVLLLVLGFAVVFGAWTIRNLHSTGNMSDDTLMINFLHHGMYPDFKYQDQQDTYGVPYKHDPDSASIAESTSSVLYEIVNRFREEPARHLRWFILGKPTVFWQWDIIQGMGDVYVYPVKTSPYTSRPFFRWTHSLSRLVHGPVVVLGLVGAVLCWFVSTGRETRSAAFCVQLIAAMLLYYQVIHMVGAPFPRYSVPLRPLIYAMAAYSIYTLSILAYEKFKRVETGDEAGT